MRAYAATLEQFLRDVGNNRLFAIMDEQYPLVVGKRAGESERASWRNSLPRLALALMDLPRSTVIALEERLPYAGLRIDAVLFGQDDAGRANAVLLELKAWSEVEGSDAEDSVVIAGQSGPRTSLHPSAQLRQYVLGLRDWSTAFQGADAIRLSGCAYCHNYTRTERAALYDARFRDVLDAHPVFSSDDAEGMVAYLHERLAGGNGASVFEEFKAAPVGPSKELVSYALATIRNQTVFHLLDTQLLANHQIVRAVSEASKAGSRKHVILVKGGPGTGKSVVALNALGKVLEHAERQKGMVALVSGSGAFTHSMRRLLEDPRHARLQIAFTHAFWNTPPDSVLALIVDEAHRIRKRSEPRVPGELRPKDISQMEELLRAARVLVLFMDENQIISPKEAGYEKSIEALARKYGADYRVFELTTQFRCAGSNRYLDWLDDLLGLNGEDRGVVLDRSEGIEFSIADSPQSLQARVKAQNALKPNSARLIAGWCWKWSDPNEDGTLVDDVRIGDFAMPWELKPLKRARRGIPEARYWAMEPAGVDQIGTVYSVQGFEMEHVGVIMGPDLAWRKGKGWVADPKKNFSNDIRGIKDPDEALIYLKRIYRTLMVRGMKSCAVYFVDEETREHVASRLGPIPPVREAAGRKTPSRGAQLPFRIVEDPSPSERHRSCVPLYSLKAAAGRPDAFQFVETREWAAPRSERRLGEGMFIAQVEGDSMVPAISPGSYCLFQGGAVADPHGQIVLMELRDHGDLPEGGRYVVKEFRRSNRGRVELISLNRRYPRLALTSKNESRIVARWVETLRRFD